MGAFLSIPLRFLPSHCWMFMLGIAFPPDGRKISDGLNKIAATALLACTNTGVLVSAGTSVRFPRKLFSLKIKSIIY